MVHASYTLFRPTGRQFKLAYILFGGTVISGTYLTILHPAKLLQTCTMGLLYLAIISTILALAHKKLPTQN